jgi:hypothetical protein
MFNAQIKRKGVANMNTFTYRRNITKSKAGHYRLTLIDKQFKIRVTDKFGWSTAEQATLRGEERLAAELAKYVERAASFRTGV